MAEPKTPPATRDELPPGSGGGSGKNPLALDAKKAATPKSEPEKK
jgi:hypothetical protein